MKKKLLTVALAATMMVASVFNAVAETATSVDTSTGFALANSGWEEVKGDFSVTYTFHNDGYLSATKDSWENFIVEIAGNSDGNGGYLNFLTAVANGGAWWWNAATATQTWADGVAISNPGLDTDKTLLDDADVVCNITRTGNVIAINATVNGTAVMTASATNAVDFPETLYIHLTGEDCKLTNIVFKNNATTAAGTTTAAGATTAAAAGTATTVASKTGDNTASTVALVAVAAVGAMFVVLASRKSKVTE